MFFVILTILSSFLSNMETKTMQSDFTITVSEEVNAPMNYPGTITMHGQLFRLTMFGLEAAYDGKTLYTYNADVDELTLSNPTEVELREANPFLYAQALIPVCNITERAITNNQSPITIITLTPKDQSIGINRFVLKLRTADLIPLSVELKEGKKTTVLRLKEPKFITTQPEYVLRPDKDTYVNDMRL